MNFLSEIFLLILLVASRHLVTGAAECKPQVSLQKCNTKFAKSANWVWRRDQRYSIQSITKTGCTTTRLEYTWTMKAIDNQNHVLVSAKFKNKPEFILDYYELDTGSYVLTVTVTEVSALSKASSRDQCLIRIRPEMPVAVILGGQVRVVPSGQPFIVDGKYSINNDVKPDADAILKWRWSCKCHTDPQNEFCRQDEISNSNEVEMPAAPDGQRFTVYLHVSTDHSPWVGTEQDINVMDGGYNIIIDCYKNCMGVINYKSSVYLQASCSDCPTRNYVWSMEPGRNNQKLRINFDNETEYGNAHRKLIVKGGVLVPGDEYKFIVTLAGGKSYSYEQLVISKLPKMDGQCEITPKQGMSMVTLFNISCPGVVHTEPVSYKLYQNNTDSGPMLLSFNVDGVFSLPLSSAAKELFVKITDPDDLYIVQNVSVSVNSALGLLPPEKQIKTIIEQHSNVNGYIKDGDLDSAINLIHMLSEEAKAVPESAEVNVQKLKLRKLLLGDLNQLLAAQSEIGQVTAVLRSVGEIDVTHDRECAKLSALLSKAIAKRQVELLNEAPFPERLHLDLVDLIPDLLWVANASLEEHFEEVVVDDVVFDVKTPENLLSYPIATENYPNYNDADLEYLDKLRDYKEATKAAVEAIRVAGLAIAMTLVPGEPVFYANSSTSIHAILTDSGRTLTKETLGGYGSAAVGSPSLLQYNEAIHGVVIAFAKNPYWWDKDFGNFSSNILHVNYFDQTKPIVNVEKPMQILFEAKWQRGSPVDATVIVPGNSAAWTSATLDRCMVVHRLDIKEGAGLIVEFHRLGADTFLDVSMSYNRRPRPQDFSATVSSLNASLVFLFPRDLLGHGDAWFYIGVLPNKRMVQGGAETDFTLKYTTSFVTPVCRYWSNAFERWISTECQTGKLTNREKIHCFCTHHSAYGGSYLKPPHQIDALRVVEFTLRPHVNYLVFTCVFLVFFLYCISLIFTTKAPGYINRQALFLSDNTETDEYAYLVIVKTGRWSFSRTTSNIGLKIYGVDDTSRAHVVNYPDPCRKLLRKNGEDWFILTTEKCMGDLDYIWLWFDSAGCRPAWFCEYIKIIDLQNKQRWFFDVNALLSVTEDGFCKVAVEPSKENQKRSWRKAFSKHTWSITEPSTGQLGYQERVTIILSVVLWTYAITLVLHATPTLSISYGLGRGKFALYPVIFIVALLSSVLSFGINVVFVTLFRKKRSCRSVWTAMILALLFSLTFLTVFGFWVPYVTGLMWMTSTIGALVQIIFLWKHVYACLTYAFNEERFDVDVDAVLEDAEQQKMKLFGALGNTLLRPYVKSKYRALTVEEWKVKKETENTRRNVGTFLHDLAMFFTYMVLLYFVVLVNRDAFNVYSHDVMKDLMITDDYDEMLTVDDLYKYVNESFISTIHSMNWYGSWNVLEPGLLADFNTKILGVARIRQLRVRETHCAVQLNYSCNPEYSSKYHDDGEYMEFWEPIAHVAVPRFAGAWKYQSDAMATLGQIAVYPGGGFSAPLGRTRYNSYYNLHYYQETQWITRRSRAFFVEFLAYNANYNIFHAVNLIIEQSATGLFLTSHNIITTRLLFVQHELETMIIVEIAAFTFVTSMMLLKTVKQPWRDYKSNVWNIVDSIIIAMSFICIGISCYRSFLVGQLLDQLERAKHNQFLNYFHLIRIEDLLTVLGAILICIATVRLWKFLRFVAMFRVMERTLWTSATHMLGLCACHVLVLLMYTLTGTIIFGPCLDDFHNVVVTLRTLMLLSMDLFQDFDVDSFLNARGTFGYAYYVSYIFIILAIYTMYVALLIICYNESDTYFSNFMEYYTIEKYVEDESRYYHELVGCYAENFRFVAGEDVAQSAGKVTAKSDEHRYANRVSVPLRKLHAMAAVARSVVFNLTRDGDDLKALDLMRRVVYDVHHQEEAPEDDMLAFFTRDPDNTVTLIGDYRLLQMEYVVRYITNLGTEENSEVDDFEPEAPVSFINPTTDTLNSTLDSLNQIMRMLKDISLVVKEPCHCSGMSRAR